MSIKIGNLDVSYFKVGGADCSIYIGDVKMYPTTPPTPSSFKYQLTLSDSTTVSAECDSTSAITRSEISIPYKSALVAAEISNCVTGIGSSAFENCTSLSSVTIPNSVTGIGGSAFSNCSSLSSVTIPNSVTGIGRAAFDSCNSLTSIDIPSSITSIEFGAFYHCDSLSSVTIPNSVTNIDYYAFYGCTSLSSVTIPSGVTSIGDFAFYGCSSLTGITVNATTPPTLESSALENTNDCPIYVPSESVDAYYDDEQWGIYDYRIEAI